MKRRVVYLDDILFELYAINIVTWRNEAMDRIVKTMIDNMKKKFLCGRNRFKGRRCIWRKR